MANLDYDKNEPNSNMIGIVVTATLFFLIVVFIASYYLFVSFLSLEQNSKYDVVKTSLLDSLNKEYDQKMNEIKWIDKSNNIVKVPIEYGIDYVVDKYNSN